MKNKFNIFTNFDCNNNIIGNYCLLVRVIKRKLVTSNKNSISSNDFYCFLVSIIMQ